MAWIESWFGVAGQVTRWQECARALLVFVYGLILLRAIGRRAFGKWTPVDIVVSIIIGSNLSRALTGHAPLLGTLAATTVLFALHSVLVHAVARSAWLSRLLEGKAIDLARDWNRNEANLLHRAVSEVDLHEALRQSGVEDIAQTRRVVLEPSGKITVLKAK